MIPGGSTTQITVTGVADTAVVVRRACKTVTVNETITIDGGPINAYVIKKPLPEEAVADAYAIPKYQGTAYVFQCPATFYRKGDIAGYIRLSTEVNTTTFDQDEDYGWAQGRQF